MIPVTYFFIIISLRALCNICWSADLTIFVCVNSINDFILGLLTLTMTNPIWVAKTRMCLRYDSAGATTLPAGGSHQYSSLPRTLRSLWRQEGLRGYYKVLSYMYSITSVISQLDRLCCWPNYIRSTKWKIWATADCQSIIIETEDHYNGEWLINLACLW